LHPHPQPCLGVRSWGNLPGFKSRAPLGWHRHSPASASLCAATAPSARPFPPRPQRYSGREVAAELPTQAGARGGNLLPSPQRSPFPTPPLTGVPEEGKGASKPSRAMMYASHTVTIILSACPARHIIGSEPEPVPRNPCPSTELPEQQGPGSCRKSRS